MNKTEKESKTCGDCKYCQTTYGKGYEDGELTLCLQLNGHKLMREGACEDYEKLK